MVRSVSDATRFTATVPFAHSKTPLRGTTIDFSASPAPAGETPQQKVARLRALAQQAKLENVSTFDKVVTKSRSWADRAHRFTALSLIGFTGIAFALTVYGAAQMITHSRQRKSEWLLQQRLKEIKELGIANEAVAKGTATEEQVLRINQDRARKAAEAEKESRPGLFKSVKNALFTSEKPSETVAVTAASPKESAKDLLSSATTKLEEVVKASPIPDQAVDSIKPELPENKSKSWYQWITRQ